jgi:hypothetical protein
VPGQQCAGVGLAGAALALATAGLRRRTTMMVLKRRREKKKRRVEGAWG